MRAVKPIHELLWVLGPEGTSSPQVRVGHEILVRGKGSVPSRDDVLAIFANDLVGVPWYD
jgi:hypothetical protein